METAIESGLFRKVLGHYPTGVCAITAMHEGRPVAMVVGSFTSVSLDPPLVGFFPDRASTSWPKIEAAGRFCVNILGAHQLDLCRALAAKGDDKFRALSWRLSEGGAPILDEVVAWIDCDLHMVADAGDHFMVLGRVRQLEAGGKPTPLLFFQSGYGGFAPLASDPS